MPKNWKYIKKQLEKEFLCDRLKGHITYELTQYKPAPWDQQHFVMKYDDTVLLEAKMRKYYFNSRDSYFDSWYIAKLVSENIRIQEGIQRSSDVQDIVDSLCLEIAEKTMEYIAHYEGFYGVEEIVNSIGIYLHSDIDAALDSTDYFCRALAILDRRCGKRRLEKYASSDREENMPGWLKSIYRIRFCTEEIKYNDFWIK